MSEDSEFKTMVREQLLRRGVFAEDYPHFE